MDQFAIGDTLNNQTPFAFPGVSPKPKSWLDKGSRTAKA
jgi:hypothetical protein